MRMEAPQCPSHDVVAREGDMASLQSFRRELRRMDEGRIPLGTDVDQICESVGSALAPHQMEVRGRPQRVDAAMSRLRVGDIDLVRLRYGSDVAIQPEPSNEVLLLQFVLSGKVEVEHDGLLTTGKEGQGLIIEDLDHRHLRWSADCEQLIIPVKRAIISRAIEMLTGRPAPPRYGFDQCFDLAQPSGASLLALARYLLHCPAPIAAPGSPAGGLVAELLAHHLILAHCDKGLIETQSSAAPYHVVRAEKYMREHFGASVSINDLASHAGVSARTLSAAFRRFRGVSPMERLRDMRLDQVRQWLLDGTAVTVASAAARAGFAHAGRFSEIYRHRYGESPNITLSNGRRS